MPQKQFIIIIIIIIIINLNHSQEDSKELVVKVDFNVIRDPNIPLGLKNYGENVCFFNSPVQALYSLPVFANYINKL